MAASYEPTTAPLPCVLIVVVVVIVGIVVFVFVLLGRYRGQFGLEAEAFVTQAGVGAGLLKPLAP